MEEEKGNLGEWLAGLRIKDVSNQVKRAAAKEGGLMEEKVKEIAEGYPMQVQQSALQRERRPYRCPICHGTGRVPTGFYDIIGVASGTTYSTAPEACRACGGTGIVWG